MLSNLAAFLVSEVWPRNENMGDLGRKMGIFTSLFLLYLGISSQAAEATMYVDNSGTPGCSDTAGQAGTEAAPFCTITYGISRLSGGDTLYVKNGIYNGDANTFTGPSGTAGHPTVISAYPGASPVIRGSGVNTGRLKFSGVSYLTFNGIAVTNTNEGIWVESSDHVSLTNCSVYAVGQDGIAVKYNSSYVTLDNCTVHDTGTWAYDGEGIYIGSSTSVSTADNTNNVIVRNSTIYNVTDEAIELKPGTHGCIVENNTVHNANTVNNGYGGAAIEVNEAVVSPQHWDSNPNHIIRNNKIYSIGLPSGGSQLINSAIRLGTGSLAYNNVIWNILSPGDGIYVTNGAYGNSDSYSRNIYHNTIDVTSARAVEISGAPVTDIRNNIGPTSTNNLATKSGYYVDQSGADYHLVSGSAPVDAGVDLISIVPTDIEGESRSANPPPDLGAYEYVGTRPDPPTNLKAVVQ